MKKLINKISAFMADETGAETVEWVMIAGALAVVIGIVYVSTLQTGLQTAMDRLTALVAPAQ